MIVVKEIKSFINKYKKSIVLWGLIGFFLPMIIVHILFKWNSGIDFLVAEWSAGDVLGYIGTILSFVGTIILSILALQAANKANDLSKKVIENEQERYRLEMRPFVLVSDWKAFEIDSKELIDDPKEKYIQIGLYKGGTALGLALELTNTTESCITVQYERGTTRNPELCWSNAAVNQENLKMSLKPGEKDKFIFYAPPKFMEKQISQRVTVELTLENRFSKRYKETFVIIITSLSDKVSLQPGKWHCHLFAQEYTIGRFEKDENGNPMCINEEL